jgi:hypothetical protein
LPVCFSPLAAAALAIGLFVRLHSERPGLWSRLGILVAWLSFALGAAGVIFHLDSHFFLRANHSQPDLRCPFAVPLAYMGLGCPLLVNRMVPLRSAEWVKWVLFFATGGFAGNFVLSLADHAANRFFHRSAWIPVFSSALSCRFFSGLFSGPSCHPAHSYSKWRVVILAWQRHQRRCAVCAFAVTQSRDPRIFGLACL